MKPPPKTPPDDQLGRIYARGWLAGARSDLDSADNARIAALNPGKTEPERRKWRDAFTAASALRVGKRGPGTEHTGGTRREDGST